MKNKVFSFLDSLGISYEVTEHPAVYTMAEMGALGLENLGVIPKNLFLRDKNKQYFLVCAAEETQINLKELGEKLLAKKLGFASTDRLQEYLGVAPGSVSPLGILNDETCAVTVVFDSRLEGLDKMGIHPNDNTATVWLSFADLEKAILAAGNPSIVIDL